MEILRAIARRICCAAGNHFYSHLLMKFRFVDEDSDSLCYEVESECVYCGHVYWSLINIPKPKPPGEKETEAGNLIQHVGYDAAQCGREK